MPCSAFLGSEGRLHVPETFPERDEAPSRREGGANGERDLGEEQGETWAVDEGLMFP